MQQPLADYPEVLTVTEAAKVLRLGRNTAYENIRSGAIPSVKLGRRLLVPKAALVRLLMATEDKPDTDQRVIH